MPLWTRGGLALLVAAAVAQPTVDAQRGGPGQAGATQGDAGAGGGRRVGGGGEAGGGGLRGGGQGQAGPLGGRGFARGRGGELPSGTAAIRGRVTTQEGAPIRGAPGGAPPPRRARGPPTTSGVPFGRLATTDANGVFELRDLPAGSWNLTASKPGFVTKRLGQRRPLETVPPLAVGDGEQVNTANFALTRGGAITGRVTDDFGDPVANARVQVLRSQVQEGRRRLTTVGVGDETDDTGSFRLYGLAPGDYYVAATLRAAPQDSSQDRAGYAPTYFPGTGNVSEAQRITLDLGQETQVSFSLLPVRTVRISGTVVSAAGGAPTNGIVALTGADGDDVGIVAPTGGQLQANGAFTISNAVPGTYVLTARTGIGRGRGGSAGGGAEAEVGMQAITIGNDDMSGITIVTSTGATLNGVVVGETSARPPLENVRVAARPLRQSNLGLANRATQAQVAANGSFSVTGLVGALTLRVDNLPAAWMVKSIEIGGNDVTDTALEIKGTEDLPPARVTLTDKIAEVNGAVTSGGSAATDYSVVIFADDESRWTFPTRFVRTARPNQQGNFVVRGLPPGPSYLAAAITYLDDGEAQDPVFLASLKERATSVSFRAGETKTIQLRLIER
jgi:hypothetical protein